MTHISPHPSIFGLVHQYSHNTAFRSFIIHWIITIHRTNQINRCKTSEQSRVIKVWDVGQIYFYLRAYYRGILSRDFICQKNVKFGFVSMAYDPNWGNNIFWNSALLLWPGWQFASIKLRFETSCNRSRCY